MAAQNFPRALAAVLVHEGGFVDHPSDPGGATNKGVTIATYRRYVNANGTVDDLRNITDAQVAQVYRKHYWDAVKADDLPSGLDYAVFDFGVNSGPSRAARYLQAILNVGVDGKIGPVTLAAARKANAQQVINRLCDDRMAFLKGLSHWPVFRKGWTNRVNGVRALALELATQPANPIAAPMPPERPEPPSGGLAIPAILAFIALALVGAFFWLS